jgi:hypothetical protein
MRGALKQKNFATGISEVYYRKFSLLKTKSEYKKPPKFGGFFRSIV